MLRGQFMIKFKEKKEAYKCTSIIFSQITRKIRKRCKKASKMQDFYTGDNY